MAWLCTHWHNASLGESGVPPDNGSSPCNGSAAALPVVRNELLARLEVAVLSVILVLALGGNLGVLLAIRSNRRKPSRMLFFVKHLSIADLVVAVFQVLPQLIWEVTFRFYAPDLVCRAVKYLQVVGMFASTYLLIVMSIDRCLTICQPLKALQQRTTRPYVLFSWLISLLFSTPQVFIFSVKEVGPGAYDCWGDFARPWGARAYITWITLSVYVLPVVVLLVCYSLISFRIWRNVWLKTQREARAASSSSSSSSSSGGTLMLSRVSSVKVISRAKIRTVKMTFVVVLAYIVCWTPFFVVQMWKVWDEHAPEENWTFVITMLLASLNSCCNPWIYMFFTGRLFHDLVQQLLCCCSLKLNKPEQPSSELTCSKKSNSSTLAISLKSSGSQKSLLFHQQHEQ
ncbi:oxytocin receptor [Stegostoma tigrinum]|uniref:oxytocin receptor n=1 Tax=Stegostoma tigrinum TaxID=3053191 RepID=UPI0028703C96|nr:oxytocin receptor [Stegostoma tigrinum]